MFFDKDLFFFLLIVIAVLVLFFYIKSKFKVLVPPSVCLITGGVKTGKTLLAVNLAIKDFKRRYRCYRFKKFFGDKKAVCPLFYTNSSISFGRLNGKKPHKLDKYIRSITLDSLLRNERFSYGSVIFIQEASLLSDNMDYHDIDRNIDLSMFCKLIGHETRGGVLYFDTQSVLDIHYSFKRVCSTYYFIQKSVNFLGLFRIVYLRELINSENGVNSFNEDADNTMKKVFIPFWYYRKYNSYEYSYLTDALDISDTPLKKNTFISFNPKYISHATKSLNKEKKNDVSQ